MRTQTKQITPSSSPERLTNGSADATYNLSGQRLGRKGQETRERIIRAMQCVLDGADPTPITLSAVAREAGVGMSTLYLYFPEMGELLLAILRRVMDQQAEAFMHCLRGRWADDALRTRSIGFVRAHFDFWQRHARLLEMRNSFADARDMRLVAYRYETTKPLIGLIVAQMDADPADLDTIQADCATVLLTGLERVATVLIKPDFATVARIDDDAGRHKYIDRLAVAEARIVEIAIREMRAQRRTGFKEKRP